MAAALLARHIGEAGVSAEVRSAGVHAMGRPACPEVVEVMAEMGFDLSGHLSQPLEPQLVTGADLVLGMAREHVREAVAMVPDAWGYTFTLRDLVRRGEASPRRGVPLGEWLGALGAGREVRKLLGASAIDDIDDPIGQPLPIIRETAAALDELASRLTRAAWNGKS